MKLNPSTAKSTSSSAWGISAYPGFSVPILGATAVEDFWNDTIAVPIGLFHRVYMCLRYAISSWLRRSTTTAHDHHELTLCALESVLPHDMPDKALAFISSSKRPDINNKNQYVLDRNFLPVSTSTFKTRFP